MPAMHEVDYKIFGRDMQYVEVELDPDEAAVAEAGAMMYMEDGIQMETIFGDGSQQQRGFLDAVIGAGKRLLIGQSMFMTVFWNRAAGKKHVARSEEHMSELQSHSFISHAVFCLKTDPGFIPLLRRAPHSPTSSAYTLSTDR